MKKLILITLTSLCLAGNISSGEASTGEKEVLFTQQEYKLVKILKVIIAIESRGKIDAYNPPEDAAGIIQIRPIMVKEANRVYPEGNFTLDCRWHAGRSMLMFQVVQLHHNPRLDIKTAAILWNTGQTNVRIKSKYWDTFRAQWKAMYEEEI